MSIDDELKQINEYLDELEKNIGFPTEFNASTINRATELMNIDFDRFRPTSEEAATAALILTSYANNVQRIINKEKSLVMWCSKRIDKIITPRFRQQTAYNYEERKLCAIAEDDVAKRLFELKSKSEIRLTRIETMYFSIKNLAEEFRNLSFKIKD
jgi:hypothetical protein